MDIARGGDTLFAEVTPRGGSRAMASAGALQKLEDGRVRLIQRERGSRLDPMTHRIERGTRQVVGPNPWGSGLAQAGLRYVFVKDPLRSLFVAGNRLASD